MYYLSHNYCHNGINCKNCNLLNQCKKGKEMFTMGLWDKIQGGIPTQNCDNCGNYQKKEVKREYNDKFQIRYNKKESIVVNYIYIDNWYEDDDKYFVAYITKQNVKTTNCFPKEKFDKFEITQSR